MYRHHPTPGPITYEIERELAERIRRGATAAVWELAEYALPAVVQVATTFSKWGVEFEDLVSSGRIGAVIAARRFNPQLGRYIPYARPFVLRSRPG